ncbi:hypothetical protein PIB30_072449 [Stylosanthes scabra]|uniref:Uncharacterized protein n=1 Tax=Stylosanthes scabra TaxID=79078 RepID=A0ABU6VQ57_9FABA|nr:hypothetical protein [Stylosanthes scabra]
MEVEREANLSDLQVNGNTQVNLDKTEIEFEAESQEPPTPGVAALDAPTTSDAPSSSILVNIVSCFKHEQEGAERKMKHMALLRDVPGLSVEERMKAALNIAKDNNLIDMVFQLQSEEMLPFLKTLL